MAIACVLMTEPGIEPTGWDLVDPDPLALDNGRWSGSPPLAKVAPDPREQLGQAGPQPRLWVWAM